MPWKIKNTTNLKDPQNPVIHMWDHTVQINLVTHLESGVVDLFIGADHPSEATVFLTIDVERDPIVRLEPTTRPLRRLDISIVSTVLESLGHNPTILSTLHRNRRRDSFVKGGTTHNRLPNRLREA